MCYINGFVNFFASKPPCFNVDVVTIAIQKTLVTRDVSTGIWVFLDYGFYGSFYVGSFC